MSHLCCIIRTDRQVAAGDFPLQRELQILPSACSGFPSETESWAAVVNVKWKLICVTPFCTGSVCWPEGARPRRRVLSLKAVDFWGIAHRNKGAWMCLMSAGEDPQKTLWKAPSAAENPTRHDCRHSQPPGANRPCYVCVCVWQTLNTLHIRSMMYRDIKAK